MSRSLKYFQPWAYIQYDNSRKLNVDTIAALLKKYQENTESQYLDLYASSMGFAIAIEAAKKAGIPIRIICQ